jgi:hypothetical protein
MRDEVSKLWGQGLSAADIVITEEDVDLPAGDYSFCPGAYLTCPCSLVPIRLSWGNGNKP